MVSEEKEGVTGTAAASAGGNLVGAVNSVAAGRGVEGLNHIAKRVRRHIIQMTGRAGSGHPGGSLSVVEILVSLYFQVLRHRPDDPKWKGRDWLVLSKAHAAPALYAVLAEAGYFPVEELLTLRQLDSRLQGHCDSTRTPGVEMSAGSIGQGLSFGLGAALSARLDDQGHRVYVVMGDGECDEGQVWEAAMAAAHFRVDNLTAIIDRNGQQLTSWTRQIMELEPLADKWRAFGWEVQEAPGHDIAALVAALSKASQVRGRPAVIIASTVKGKGVSFMENNPQFHGKAPSAEEMEKALRELE